MAQKKIKISPEYSAQPSVAKPNSLLEIAIQYILNKNLVRSKLLKIADYGCGRLRHFHIFLKYFDVIYLVDTEFQLSRLIKLFGKKTTIKQYIANIKTSKKIEVLNNYEFESSKLNLDIVFSIAVFDVVPPKTRTNMIKSSYENLKKGGFL